MRKALLPMVAVLLLSGAATIALVATNARAAQDGRKPMMIALMAPDSARRTAAAPPQEEGSLRGQNVLRETRPEPRLDREQLCHDLYARKAGELAFLEAKLSLDAKQAPLFARWKQASLDIAKRNEGDCAGRPPRRDLRAHRPNAVDRMTLEEDMLKKRLADIQAERPAMSALYNALTPAQKEEFTPTHPMPGRFNVMFNMLDRPHPGMALMRQSPMNGPQNAPMVGPPPPAR